MFNAFLKLDGVRGEGKINGYVGWIELKAQSLADEARPLSAPSRGGRQAKLSRVHCVTRVGAHTPTLSQAAAKGTNFAKATLAVTKDGGKTLVFDFEMEDVGIEMHDVNGSNDESFTLVLKRGVFRVGTSADASVPVKAEQVRLLHELKHRSN